MVRESKTEDEVNEQMSGDDRARGLMVGIAAGNLLGIVQEGRSKQEIAEEYPDGVRKIEERPGCPDDDDLAQALIVAEAAERGPLDPDDLGRRFWDWGETNGRGMGNLTRDVLKLYGPRRGARAAAGAGRHADHRGVADRGGRRAGRERGADALRARRDPLA